MEQSILDFLKAIGWPGVVGLFIWKGLPLIMEFLDKKIVKNNLLPKAESALIEIKDNHLHDLKNCINDIKESNRRIESHLEKMNDNLVYIKARFNGKNL